MNRTFLFLFSFVIILQSHAYSQNDKHSSLLIPSDSMDANFRDGVLFRSHIQSSEDESKSPLAMNRVTHSVVNSELSFVRLWNDSLNGNATAIAITKKGTILVGCGMQSRFGILRSIDQGRTWKDVGPKIIGGQGFTINDSGWIYACIFGNLGQALLRSKNDGETWEPIVGSPQSGLAKLDWGFKLAISPKGDYFFATNEGMWRSLGGDSSWISINNGIPKSRFRDTPASVRSIVFFGSKIYIVRSYDLPDSTNVILSSTDNGDSWSQACIGIPKGTPLKTLVVHGNHLLTGGLFNPMNPLFGPNSIYVSNDSGVSWKMSYPNFSVHILRENTYGDLYAGAELHQVPTTHVGAYQSFDDGASWRFIGPDSIDVWDMTFDDAGYCFIASQGYYQVNAGLYRSLNPTTVESQSTADANNFTLFQNYPNPFNPSTTISFHLRAKAFVLLKVFDVLGRDVATLVNAQKPAGTYIQKWNAANMPSGIYFYRLQAGSFTETKKIVLVR